MQITIGCRSNGSLRSCRCQRLIAALHPLSCNALLCTLQQRFKRACSSMMRCCASARDRSASLRPVAYAPARAMASRRSASVQGSRSSTSSAPETACMPAAPGDPDAGIPVRVKNTRESSLWPPSTLLYTDGEEACTRHCTLLHAHDLPLPKALMGFDKQSRS